MLNYMKNEFNKTITQNGDKAFLSTNSDVLDLFAHGGAMRNASLDKKKRKIINALNEDLYLGVKTMFHLGNVRGGEGERLLFRTFLLILGEKHPEVLKAILPLVPHYTRWDNLWILLDTEFKKDVLQIIEQEVHKTLDEGQTSLMYKWLKLPNASSPTSARYGKIVQDFFFKKYSVTPRDFRKFVVQKRAELGNAIVENKISVGNFKDIDYSKIPSRAGMKYRKLFLNKDNARYVNFISKVEKGEAKMNSSMLYPHEIAGKFLQYGKPSVQEKSVLNAMWLNLPNYAGDDSALVMADVSGSMSGTPLEVSVSLALYFAERNRGAFANHFMTFSSVPQLVEVKGSTLEEKFLNISRAKWEMNTNLDSALMTILNVGKTNNVSQEDFPKTLIIISDMQFDECVRGSNTSAFERAKSAYEKAGYKLPNIIFWDVAGGANVPVTKNEVGVGLVSGYSPAKFKMVTSGGNYTPYDLMLEILNQDMYKPLDEVLS